MPRRLLPVLPALLLAAPLAAQADAPAAPADHAAAPRVLAHAAASPLRVDGRLDEEAWSRAEPLTGFTQLDPREGEPASERTEVRVVYDGEALYLGARLHDSRPVTTRLGRRDMSMEASDWLTVILDSYHDHRTAYGFEVNPSGVRRDQTRSDAGEDDSWDPVWEVATAVDGGGWTAEMRIPFSQLRFNPAQEQTWGLQVERQVARNREFAVFSFTPRTQPGGIPRFGHLGGLRGLRPGKRLEVLPYTVVKAEHVDRVGNPFRDDREYAPSAGVDLKYRLTSDLTLDATLNPDFGQVEVDPAEVNLSVIETRYQEKRPFFVEGAEIFDFGSGAGNTVFYSRRIGRAPQGALPPDASDLADVPVQTRILGAAKLSGRTSGGWSVGVLDALTRRETARYLDLSPDARARTAPVEPLTNYLVARARRDLRAGRTVLGGMLTAVNRDLETEVLEGALHRQAYTGGVDFRHEWAGRTWTVSGFVSGSHVAGSREAILLTQRAPWRYFQRPDHEGLRLDPDRTSLSGVSGELSLSHRRGRHWRYALEAATVSPGYEVNDLGFQYRANRADVEGSVTYVQSRPGTLFRYWQTSAVARGEWNYARDHIYNLFALRTYGELTSYWNATLNVGYTLPSWDDRLTRGGPLARRPTVGDVYARVGSDDRRRVSGEAGAYYRGDVEGGRTWELFGNVAWKPTPGVSVVVGPSVARARVPAQYVATVPDPAATRTYGARYVFAGLDQTTVAVETRLNVTFTPDLSLQVYAQPFLASADYGRPGELAAPRTFDFLEYGRELGSLVGGRHGYEVYLEGAGDEPSFTLPNRDFNLRSLRGNAVLRWEYRPGSTLYLAWQQDRSDHEPLVGDFDLGRDRRALFDAMPDNVFVVKVSYWLNP